MKLEQDILTKLGKAITNEYRKQLSKVGAVASGNLGNNASFVIEAYGTTYKIDLQLEEYWKEVEYGRRRGSFPPPNAIQKWMRIKGIAPVGRTTIPQLTYAISKSIAKNGIRGRHPLERAMNNSLQELDTALDGIVDTLIDQLIAEIE